MATPLAAGFRASTPICSPISSGVPVRMSTGTLLIYFNSPLPCLPSGKRKGSPARPAKPAHKSTANARQDRIFMEFLRTEELLDQPGTRSEEHTSELQSPYVISY